MRWKKQGIIYAPDGTFGWAQTHAAVPTPEILGDRIRIYFGSRDKLGIARISYIEVAGNDPKQILATSEIPSLDIGLPGTFDENGVLPFSIVNLVNGYKYLYYTGFEIGNKVPYRMLTGVAQSTDNGHTFKRIRQTPILERSEKELFFRCATFVMFDENKFKSWYVAGNSWTIINGKTLPIYEIKYLESTDGITWDSEGHTCIPISNPDEHGFGRPYIIKEAGLYKMFYSIRIKHQGYRLGYAESINGKDWERRDDALGLNVSLTGWDSEMACFPAITRYDDQTYLFYNGNNFGQTGIGYAILE